MKLLLCVLSALLLAGCAAEAASGDAISASAPAATVETAEAAPTPVPAAAAPQGLEPTGAAVLDYDDIRLIDYERAMQPYPETDYYTMCKGRPVGPDAQRWYRSASLPRAGAAV